MNIRILTVIASLLFPTFANAGSATWALNPISSDWNTAANWTPQTVPNGAGDVATFGASNSPLVEVFQPSSEGITTTVAALVFESGAPLYVFDSEADSTLIVGNFINNPGVPVSFNLNFGQMEILGGTTTNTFFDLSSGDHAFPSEADFRGNSSAANGTFTIQAGTYAGAALTFGDSATADHATVSTGGGFGLEEVNGGRVYFFGNSSAGQGTFTNDGGGIDEPGQVTHKGGGTTIFDDTSTAADSTLIANGGIGGGLGGSIAFFNDSTGGTSRVELFGNGSLDISSHNPGAVTVGSIEGSGNIFLGANNLTVGSNNMSTTFSGVVQDGGSNGSLTKIGTGTLTLSGNNTYTGDTTVSSGTLLVNNSTGSGTGTGAVRIIAGTLGGTGTIAGAVIVGTGNGTGAFISPGTSPGTLTIQSSLTLNSDATYKFELNSTSAVADKIVAKGVTLDGAVFSFADLGSGKLTLGTTFVVIDNTSTAPIVGLFSNLADGSTFSSNGNTYFVSYEGGTGNDLTLTSVVPEPTTCTILILGAVLWSAASRLRKNSD